MLENLQINIYNSFSPQLEKLWHEFEIEAAWSPFQTYGWLSHWQNTVGGPLHKIIPQIAVLKKDNLIIAILPTGICKKMGIRVLEWLGGIHTDYMGPLLYKDYYLHINDFQTVWKEILKLMNPVDVIHLRRQPKMIGSIENPFVTVFKVTHTDNAYKSNLTGKWEEFYNNRIKKKMRADSIRQRKCMGKKGNLVFKIADSDFEANIIIKKMIEQKSQRYQDTGVTDMLAVQQHRDFYRGMVGLPLGAFNLTCSALMINDFIVATHVGIVNENCFYYLMPANQSGEWQAYSAGRILLENLVSWSFESAIKTFDFTIGDEQYKKNWCDEEIKLFEYIEPVNYKGKCYVYFQVFIKKLKNNPNLWELFRKARFLVRKLTHHFFLKTYSL